MNDLNWFVTGGAGFIGSNFIKYIFETYPEDVIICFDKLTYAGSMDNIKEYVNNPRFVFVRGDICSEVDIGRALSSYSVDFIVNFAAESHVDRSIYNSECFLETNVIGTNVLLEAAKKFGISRFHQVSTDEVYGDLPLIESTSPFLEEDALRPSSSYAVSKASADMLVLSYKKTFHLPVTISRCSNNFGPKQHFEKFIPMVIKKACLGEQIPVYGSGENIRDWIYVEDHCRAIDMIVRYGKAGSIYNVGANNEISNNSIVEIILKILGKPKALITYVSDRPGHDLKYSLNCQKIGQELMWKNNSNFLDRLKYTVHWYVENEFE